MSQHTLDIAPEDLLVRFYVARPLVPNCWRHNVALGSADEYQQCTRSDTWRGKIKYLKLPVVE